MSWLDFARIASIGVEAPAALAVTYPNGKTKLVEEIDET